MSLNIEESYNRFVEEHGFTFEDVLKYLGKTIDEVDSVKEIKLAIKKMDATKRVDKILSLDDFVEFSRMIEKVTMRCFLIKLLREVEE